MRGIAASASILTVIAALTVGTVRVCAAQSSGSSSEKVERVGGEVTAPHVIKKVNPKYDSHSRKEKISGTVLLTLIVDKSGMPRDIQVIRSLNPGLDVKAVDAVKKWRFAPGTKKGEPVNVKATIEVNFKIF